MKTGIRDKLVENPSRNFKGYHAHLLALVLGSVVTVVFILAQRELLERYSWLAVICNRKGASEDRLQSQERPS